MCKQFRFSKQIDCEHCYEIDKRILYFRFSIHEETKIRPNENPFFETKGEFFPPRLQFLQKNKKLFKIIPLSNQERKGFEDREIYLE